MGTVKIKPDAINPDAMIDRSRNEYYEVKGAGKIEISKNTGWSCGGETGFSLSVTWGKYGLCGGVLPEKEAEALANHILKTLGKRTSPIN